MQTLERKSSWGILRKAVMSGATKTIRKIEKAMFE
jgi:hypothetical protein